MTISTKKAIVVGATGLVGLALVEQLEQTPEFEAITVVVRKESQLLNTSLYTTKIDNSL
ncbi:nucleoside-diphosphate sugar epimerase, partial [Acinetobacter baumannii]